MSEEEFRALVGEVCAALGYALEPKSPSRHTTHFARARGADGTGLEFGIDYQDKRRLRVRGVYPCLDDDPTHVFPDPPRQKGPLTVGYSLGAPAIVRAFVRRFLKDYRRAFLEGLRQKAAYLQAEGRARCLARGLAEAAGCCVGDSPPTMLYGCVGGGAASVRGEVGHETVHLDLHGLSPGQALAVMRALGRGGEAP